MIDISLNKITMNYGFKDILKNISLDINKGDIVSIIGSNGCGKTTLLNIISGDEIPTSGTISRRKGIKIGYLNQIINTNDITVRNLLYSSFSDIKDIEDRLHKYEDKMNKCSGKELDRIIIKYTNLQNEYINMGGYEIDEKVGKIVKGFNLEKLLNLNYNTLSGGEKRKVTFAKIMLNNPDILLLDEPTNHLDIGTLNWLEDYLKSYKGTIVLVSHDRYFLDRISSKIILIENGNINIFNGNYTKFIEDNEQRLMLEFKDYKDQQKQIKAMKESIKKLKEYGRLANPGGESFFKRAASIQKRLDKIEELNKPKQVSLIPLEFSMESRSGKDVLSINNLSIKYDDKLIFNNISLDIKYQDRVCIIGSNGSGKSTLIKEIINGNDNIKLGTNINIGYIPQEISFTEDSTIYEEARKYYIGDESHLRSSLFKFLFDKSVMNKKTQKLSGGEKVRLKLFCLMQQNINLLILDEPTNHIDITTREVLEETLKEYKGTLIFVSHDRYFINKIANKILSIENNNIYEYIGNYDDYQSYMV